MKGKTSYAHFVDGALSVNSSIKAIDLVTFFFFLSLSLSPLILAWPLLRTTEKVETSYIGRIYHNGAFSIDKMAMSVTL